MVILNSFFFGFAAALVGIIPPGLLNMTAAKVNLREGIRHAVAFVFGALLVIALQVSLAIFFARVINGRPDLVVLLREIGFVVFSVLTIYFLVIAKKPKIKEPGLQLNSKKSRFFLGVLLSGLNLFPIPYYVFISITLASYHLMTFGSDCVSVFVSGVVLGSLVGFYGYIKFFKKMESKTDALLGNMNIIIGSITGLVAVLALLNIIQYYW